MADGGRGDLSGEATRLTGTLTTISPKPSPIA
jgi:hypothetical protein